VERLAADDDLVTCPSCGSRAGLTVRWIPDIDHEVHERTDAGCVTCNQWRSGKMGKWAYAQWNHWACDQWSRVGEVNPRAELYALLCTEMEHEQRAAAAQSAVDAYLLREVAERCEWRIGDRFTAPRPQRGAWSVRGVRAVYGTNTGPFCILSCRNVLPGGSLGDVGYEFWDSAPLQRIPPFWKPRTWSQVCAGDECYIGNNFGTVVSVTPDRSVADIQVGGGRVTVTRLQGLRVPVARVEQ
jgi:hypothetical protein